MSETEFKKICTEVFKDYGAVTFAPCPAVNEWPQAYLQYFHARSKKLVARYFPFEQTAKAFSDESDYDDSIVEDPEAFRKILEYVRDHLDYIFRIKFIDGETGKLKEEISSSQVDNTP